MQHKIGDDREFETMQRRYRGGASAGGASFGDTGGLEIPRTATGEIDPAQLSPGKTYSDGSGGKWLWTGSDFVEAP